MLCVVLPHPVRDRASKNKHGASTLARPFKSRPQSLASSISDGQPLFLLSYRKAIACVTHGSPVNLSVPVFHSFSKLGRRGEVPALKVGGGERMVFKRIPDVSSRCPRGC